MANLIFDVGMNNGDDTAYYLHRGYRVVAVEADPKLCDRARERFQHEIGSGRLSVENVGIAREEGNLQFWISSKSVWSSFDRENATKGRATATPLIIHTLPFSALIEKYGKPYYVKVDIEGHDFMCLEQLTTETAPTFVSIEMSYTGGDEAISRLLELGYDAFKVVRQNDFFPMTRSDLDREMKIRKRYAMFGPYGQHLRRLTRRQLKLGDWRFRFGSSGPISSELSGTWLSPEEARSVWQRLHDVDMEIGSGGRGEWYDFHARMPTSPRSEA